MGLEKRLRSYRALSFQQGHNGLVVDIRYVAEVVQMFQEDRDNWQRLAQELNMELRQLRRGAMNDQGKMDLGDATPTIPDVGTLEEFTQWVQSLPHNALVGDQADTRHCPIANYLRQTKGCLEPMVFAHTYTCGNNTGRLPLWAVRLIWRLDYKRVQDGTSLLRTSVLNTIRDLDKGVGE